MTFSCFALWSFFPHLRKSKGFVFKKWARKFDGKWKPIRWLDSDFVLQSNGNHFLPLVPRALLGDWMQFEWLLQESSIISDDSQELLIYSVLCVYLFVWVCVCVGWSVYVLYWQWFRASAVSLAKPVWFGPRCNCIPNKFYCWGLPAAASPKRELTHTHTEIPSALNDGRGQSF